MHGTPARRRAGGYTLIELLLALALIAVIAAGAVTVLRDWGSDSISLGIHGVVETRCVSGLRVVVGQSGSVQQLLDEKGGGIPCR